MEEREALKRQIELLQNLINNHKSVHGDAPSSTSQWRPLRHESTRGRGHAAPSFSAQPQPYAPRPTGHWRKTYSLNNKTAGAHEGLPIPAAQPSLNQPSLLSSAAGTSEGSSRHSSTELGIGDPGNLEKRDKTTGVDKTGSVTLRGKSKPPNGSGMTSAELTVTGTKAAAVAGMALNLGLAKSGILAVDRQSELKKDMQLKSPVKSAGMSLKITEAKACDPATSMVPSLAKVEGTAQLQIKPRLPGRTKPNPASKQAVATATAHRDATPHVLHTSASIAPSSPVLTPRTKPDPAQPQRVSSPLKKSQFTWVKSQEAREGTSKAKPEAHHPGPHGRTSPIPASGHRPGVASTRRVPGPNRKTPRRLSISSGATKTSKYTWVSSSSSSSTVAKAGLVARLPRKPLSPKTLRVLQKTPPEGGEGARKPNAATLPSAKLKRGAGAGLSGSSTPRVQVSRYCWKAGAQSPNVLVSGSSSGLVRRGSVYHWTSEKENGPKGMRGTGESRLPPSLTPSSSPAGFKLRSRMKIIRRSASSYPGSERRTSPGMVMLNSRYSLRRRTHTPVRKAQGRALVSFGRHKLRRLSPSASPGASRTGPSSPSVHRVIKTRYKIDTRRGAGATAHTHHHNPALSWRAKRVQSARTLLQSRLRTPMDRPWRGRAMRWIGGALYQVSANKLSRTQTTSTPTNRTGKWYGPQEVSFSPPSSLYRASSTRHVASRAVQRSLAIIRHARQRKQQARQARHYCMYYNRFGKCNHGDACPYIHDPDKVAVCTRFLRGTCKQTDGTCPFSHKVSKEKMPVCSYFLKGICNNSSCPYSHVYVSRKAAVCQDFIRGYCPQGEKCKKKHTLVCPDFSSTGACPRGTKCKLQHRQRAKRAGPSLPSGAAKRVRTKDGPKRSEPASSLPTEAQADERTACSGPQKLPSFISLSSSPETPESGDSPSTPPAARAEGTGKTLHIKPRF